MDSQERQYIKGFNSGYILAKYDPELLKKVIKEIQPATDFLEGFFSGKEEYELEHIRIQVDELKNIRNKPQDRNKGFTRD